MARKKNSSDSSFFINNEKEELLSDLRQFGYLLPTNDEELEAFNAIHGPTQAILPKKFEEPHFLNPSKRVEEVQKPAIDEKKNSKQNDRFLNSSKGVSKQQQIQADYFMKVVLAAEITYQLYQESTFGHKKLVKVQYLCEEVCSMKLSSNYRKYAAGPLDPKLMYSIDAEFKKQKWFNVVKRKSFGYMYLPLENVGKHRDYYLKYYGNQREDIDYIISLFKAAKSDFCEIVATLYYVWKECLQNTILVNEATLIDRFYKWGDEKHKFKANDLSNAIQWMYAKEIVPSPNNGYSTSTK